MKRKRPTPLQRLMAGMYRCAVARGEAQWTNGYRTGNPSREAALFAKEQKQWRMCGEVEKRFRQVASRVLRAAGSAAARKRRGGQTPEGRT